MKDFFNNIFATFYESWFKLYDSQFALIFDTLYDDGGYILLGVTFTLVPLVMFLSFYKVWIYPYGRFWHWLLWLVIASMIAGGISWGIINNSIFMSDNQALIDALADPESGYEDFAQTLPLEYTIVNSIASLILGFIYSLFLKQFSKIQIHLPF